MGTVGRRLCFVVERCGVGTDYGGRRRRRVARADHIWNCLAGPNSGGRSADHPCTFSNQNRPKPKLPTRDVDGVARRH